jgi:beta-glucosidase
MPGPSRWRGELVNHALLSNKISQHTLDQRVREVLKLVSRAIQTGVPENAFEGTRDVPETAELLRRISGESIVLLKNNGGVLPFKKEKTVCYPLLRVIKLARS